ncbi:MAG: hypothetical protein GQ571_02115 [Desulfobacterales bacterium]|jgi:hypothetical protein|nr:hypothetical protein [Desulfobacterales bacterium]
MTRQTPLDLTAQIIEKAKYCRQCEFACPVGRSFLEIVSFGSTRRALKGGVYAEN